jgi:hypothetical protein
MHKQNPDARPPSQDQRRCALQNAVWSGRSLSETGKSNFIAIEFMKFKVTVEK